MFLMVKDGKNYSSDKIKKVLKLESLLPSVLSVIINEYENRGYLPMSVSIKSNEYSNHYACCLLNQELTKRYEPSKITVLPYENNGNSSFYIDLDNL